MRKILFVLAATLFSNTVIGGQWLNDVTISYVYSGTVGNRVAVGITGMSSIGTCPGAEMVITDLNSDFFKPTFSILLAAKTSGQKISLYTDGTCTPAGLATLNDVRF